MTTTCLSERGGAPALATALQADRIEELARLAALEVSYWRSIELAVERGDILTVAMHCRQVAAVTREAFSIVKTIAAVEGE